MIRFFCDGCGAELKESSHWISFGQESRPTMTSYIVERNHDQVADGAKHQVCRACYQRLMAVLMMPGPGDVFVNLRDTIRVPLPAEGSD